MFAEGEKGYLKELDVALYKDFAMAMRKGDKLAGHEVLQNSWLKSMGLIKGRGVGKLSRNNPALAVGQKLHKLIGKKQRELGLFNPKYLKTLNSTEIINLNVIAMKQANVPMDTIRVIAKEALKHAKTISK